MRQALRELAEQEKGGVQVGEIDADAYPAIANDYGPEAIFKFNRISAKARIIDPSKLDDDNTIADLEEPAFRHARRPTFSRPATPSAAQPDAETPKADDNSRPGTKINFNDI